MAIQHLVIKPQYITIKITKQAVLKT